MLEIALTVVALFIAVAVVKQAGSRGDEDSFYDLSDGERHPHKWGYTDTRFEFDGPKTVRVTGSRYPLAGYTLPHLIPFVEEMLQVSVNPDEMATEKEAQDVPASHAEEGLVAALGEEPVADEALERAGQRDQRLLPPAEVVEQRELDRVVVPRLRRRQVLFLQRRRLLGVLRVVARDVRVEAVLRVLEEGGGGREPRHVAQFCCSLCSTKAVNR